MRGTPFGFSSQRNMEFPSTTAVQVFCLCGDEVFLLALGKSLSCKLKEPHSPRPMQPLALPGVLSSTGHCNGNSAQPGQTPQNLAKWERGASKAHPTMGPSGQGSWSWQQEVGDGLLLREKWCSPIPAGSCSGSWLHLAFTVMTWHVLDINPDKLLTSKTSCNWGLPCLVAIWCEKVLPLITITFAPAAEFHWTSYFKDNVNINSSLSYLSHPLSSYISHVHSY